MKLVVTKGSEVKVNPKEYTFAEVCKRAGVYQVIEGTLDFGVFFISFYTNNNSTAVLYVNTDGKPIDVEVANKSSWKDDKFVESNQSFTFKIN